VGSSEIARRDLLDDFGMKSLSLMEGNNDADGASPIDPMATFAS
jgi:hypothetical protein